MKKIAITAMALLVLLITQAQVDAGIKGGLNIARLSGFDGDSRVSVHVGGFIHYPLNRNWCIQPELIYSGEGQEYFSEGDERTIALDYVSIPLMIQYFPATRFYFEAGPQIGFLVSAQDKGMDNDNINVKKDFRNSQVGLNLGIGFKPNNRVGIYARYHFGLTDVSLFDEIVDHSQVGQVGVSLRL
jgi:hypothetical protein